MAKISGIAIAEITAGLIIGWSGIENQKIGDTIRTVLSGKVPAQAFSSGGTGSVNTPIGKVTTTDSAIANDALKYRGAGYHWAGAPANGIGDWDCSSYANKVIGIDLGLAIPGYAPGQYNGSIHGPTTISWLGWTGCQTIPRSQCNAGDLCVWQTHMGIAISNTQMISALNQSLGTDITTIDGTVSGEILAVRRLKAAH